METSLHHCTLHGIMYDIVGAFRISQGHNLQQSLALHVSEDAIVYIKYYNHAHTCIQISKICLSLKLNLLKITYLQYQHNYIISCCLFVTVQVSEQW